MKKTKVSVVVPTRNSERTIGKCLDAISNQMYPPDEVIVVDGGSNDATVNIAKKNGVKVIHQESIGLSSARNIGVENIKGSLIAFLDSDCYPEKTWLQNVVATLLNPKIGIYTVIVRDGTDKIVSRAWHNLYRCMNFDFAPTRCMAIRKSFFVKVNGFDVSLPTAEDNDLSYRIEELGLTILVDKETKVYHDDDHLRSLRGVWQQQRWYRTGELKVRRKYPYKFRRFKTSRPLREHLIPLFKSFHFGFRFGVVCFLIKFISLWRHL